MTTTNNGVNNAALREAFRVSSIETLVLAINNDIATALTLTLTAGADPNIVNVNG